MDANSSNSRLLTHVLHFGCVWLFAFVPNIPRSSVIEAAFGFSMLVAKRDDEFATTLC